VTSLKDFQTSNAREVGLRTPFGPNASGITQITQQCMIGRYRDRKRSTASDMMFGKPHPNCRRHHNRPLLRDQLGGSPAHFAAEKGINAGRKLWPVLLR
jgi:hypothetical protein